MVRSEQKQGFWATVKEISFLLVIIFLIRTFVFGLYQVPTGSMETTMLVGERFFADKFTYLFKKPQREDIIAFNSPLFKYSKNPVMRLFEEYVWGPDNWTKRIIAGPGDTVRGTVEDGKPVVYVNGKKLDEPYINQYPLISFWDTNPQELLNQINRQAYFTSSKDPAYQAILERICRKHMFTRSYDPTKPYEQQLFYRINPAFICRDLQGNPQVLEPGYPIHDTRVTTGKEAETEHWNGTDDYFVELKNNQYWVMGDNRLGSQDSRFFGPLDGRLIHGKIRLRIWSIDSSESWWIVDLIKHPIDFFKRIRWSRFFQVMK